MITALAAGVPAEARVLIATDEALRLAFPACQVQRATVFLSAAQQRRAGELAGAPVPSAVVTPYRATCGGKPGGSAYLDVHRVRTLQETLLVTVDPQGRVGRVEVLAFDEPADYLPRRPWYDQLGGRGLDGELQLGRGVHRVTGASLTARATTDAVRRVLAVDRVLREAAAPPATAPTPSPQGGRP